MNLKTNPLSVDIIEKYAQIMRNFFSISNDEFFPIYEVLEHFQNEEKLSIQILEDSDLIFEDDKELAKYNGKENYLYLKESLLEDYENNIYTSNFTLAHELFHFMQLNLLNFKFIECENVRPYEDPEWQANEFAAQLLIPSEFIDLSENELSSKFHVTVECALYRKLKYKQRKERKAKFV